MSGRAPTILNSPSNFGLKYVALGWSVMQLNLVETLNVKLMNGYGILQHRI